MNKTLIVMAMLATNLCAYAQPKISDAEVRNLSFNNSRIENWIALAEDLTYDQVKMVMTQSKYTVEKTTVKDANEQINFSNKEGDKVLLLFKNKVIIEMAGTVFLMTQPQMLNYLKDKGYTIVAKETIKNGKEKKAVNTWGKKTSPYKFIFQEGGTFTSILKIKIDRIAIANMAPVNLDEAPPVQAFLDKIAGKKFEENMSDQQNISQTLTNTSFILLSKHLSSGKIYKNEVKGISWKNFSSVKIYSVKNEDKFLECRFEFYNNLKKKYYSNDKEYNSSEKYNYFTCFIYAKDKEAFLKTVKDWENSRN